MVWKTIIGVYILVIGLLVSNVLSMVWMLLLQIGALAGLIFIGTLFWHSWFHGSEDDGDDYHPP